jgi:DNA-binding GntR family transcriptional regulator
MPAIPMGAAQVAEDLAARIASGEYGPPGTQLPRYEDLAELYSVGMRTVSTVMMILKMQGVVVSVQGKGTFVAEGGTRETRS